MVPDQPINRLRAIDREHDLDAARGTAKWKDAEKLAEFIADQIDSRASRSPSFLEALILGE